MTRQAQNLSDRELVDAADRRRADLVDPSTGEAIGAAAGCGPEELNHAYPRTSNASIPGAMRMTCRLEFSCVRVNTHLPIAAELLRGGFKHSGYGKDLSVYGQQDCTRIPHVRHNIDF